MVLKLPSRCRKRNHLARRRIDLVCSAVESLLRHCGTASIVDGSVFSLDAAAEAEAAEAEKTSSSSPSSENRSPPPPPPSDLQQLNRGDSGVNSSNNNTNDSSRTTTIGTHCTENGRTEGLLLVDLLCAHLFAALKNHYHHHQSNLLIIIIVVAEGELARLQTALEGWKTKLESEGVKWRRVRIRLIKVAGVGGGDKDTEEKVQQNKSTEEEEEEEDENEQTIEATAQALHLLSRPLHSPITSASIPDTTRAEAAFLQYNIARINSILDKYSRSSSSIKSGGDYISDDQSTTTTTISPDCTKVVPEAAAASAASASANLKSLTADDEWHLVLLYWLPLAQLADELYSQLLLMETETTMTGDSADINDQQEEENHAKTVMVTSAAEAEAVAVDVCCPVLDVHKVSRLLARLAHGFSVYYRKVKILRLQLPPSAEESSRAEEEASETNAATATDAKTKTAAAATDHHYHHLLQLMAARVRLCALIRQQLLFYLCSLLGIAAVQKM